jgi:lipopolysaccharide/colanic/teichoic acid biosynthesis glycosyltransferase
VTAVFDPPSVAPPELAWLNRFPRRSAPTRSSLIAKRLLDLTVVAVLAPVVVVVVAGLAGMLKLSDPRAPVFHAQMRTGRGGRRFKLWKLRSMVADADARRDELVAANARSWPDFKVIDDPRVTRIGRFLRASHMDELPQLWSIAVGDMSLVGPRPTSFGIERYQPHHLARLEGTPGLTGLWQISSPRSPSFDDRVALDIEYLARRSLVLDVLIMLRTIPYVLLGRGDR